MLKNLVKDKRGAGMMEYAILIGFICIIVMAAVQTFGKNLREKVNSQATEVTKIGQ